MRAPKPRRHGSVVLWLWSLAACLAGGCPTASTVGREPGGSGRMENAGAG